MSAGDWAAANVTQLQRELDALKYQVCKLDKLITDLTKELRSGVKSA